MQAYSAIIGAYEMKKNCKITSEYREGNFELSISVIQKNLLHRGIDKAHLQKLNRDSRKVAAKEPYSKCGLEARQAIEKSFKISWQWAIYAAKN